ncbi:MAG: hypothetical protein IPJ68_05440 [Candidatus Moraniibacteriota bacterium]|nr:MAG: hypothetical protein IPJ68_05440 [Candidatus Moranbacteria bacterium]
MKTIPVSLKDIEQVLVYAYIGQIPFSWRIILDPSRSGFHAAFSEYMDISIYIGEIILAIALLIHIINKKREEKSIVTSIINQVKNEFHVERNILWILLLIFLTMNIFASIDVRLSISSALHFSLIFGAIVLIQNQFVSRGTKFIIDLVYIFSFSTLFQLFISGYQVIHGSSIGVKALNESILSLGALNVAKAHIFGHLVLRGYGTFPHPNVFAVYAMFVLIFIYLFRRYLFHVKHLFLYPIVLFTTMSILLTQSKLMIIFLMLMILFMYKKKLISMFHVKHVIVTTVLLASIVAFTLLSYIDISVSTKTRLSQAISQVGNYAPTLFGSGIGTYRLSYDNMPLEWWNYEPIHFVPFIVLSELGILPTILLLMILRKYFRKVPRETWNNIQIPTIFLILILSIDHYAWDIYQGSFIAAMLAWSIYTIDKCNIVSHNVALNNSESINS